MVDIGTLRQFFFDDFIVERAERVETLFHPATKEPEPVLVADRPWERPGFLGVLGNCVFCDEEEKVFKMYYQAYRLGPDLSERLCLALALSDDGRFWEKPALGLVEEKGSRRNNLIFGPDDPRWARDWWAYNNVFRDPRDPDPRRRYKALGHGIFGRTTRQPRSGMIVAFSADGLRWTEPSENPVLPNGDTHTLLGWDNRIGQYVAYPRTAKAEGFASEIHCDANTQEYVVRTRGPLRRCIGRSTSEDFIHWSAAETVLAPRPDDPPDYEIYGMPVFQCEGLYLGLPWSFIGADWEPLDTRLAVSRDGRHWQYLGGQEKFIPLGPPGSFDDCYAVAAAPVQVGEELFFYYMGAGFPHGFPYGEERQHEGVIGLGRLRMDRFISLGCRFDGGGEVVTKPLRFAGRRLQVNCDCSRGWLRVELCDPQGRPIPGFAEAECDAVCTDALRQVITWQGRSEVGALAGMPIKVRLHFGDGQLYSFGFAE